MCRLSLVSASGDYSLVAIHGLPIVVASLVAGHRLSGTQASVVAAHKLSSAVCGIIPDQGSNICPLNWQADS